MQRPFRCLQATITLTQESPFKGVVMNTKDVADDMLPAIVADDWTGRVKGFGQVVERLNVVTLHRITGHIRHAPTLVKRDPCHDARMVIVTSKYLQPFACQPLYSDRRENIGVSHLTPDQQAKTVAPVEKAGVFDLLVDTHTVEAQFLS